MDRIEIELDQLLNIESIKDLIVSQLNSRIRELVTLHTVDYRVENAIKDRISKKVSEVIQEIIDDELKDIQKIRDIVRSQLEKSIKRKLDYLDKKGSIDLVPSSEPIPDKWTWMMNFCRVSGMAPADARNWNRAEAEYNRAFEIHSK